MPSLLTEQAGTLPHLGQLLFQCSRKALT